ncbi:hypothetical protein GW17_00025627 [Ensete ventricosum]|nr:hypothetical protein GW17_00025627 [Ensete ventricosum]
MRATQYRCIVPYQAELSMSVWTDRPLSGSTAKIDRRRSIEGEKGKKKKKKRKRRKKKEEEKQKEYLAPSSLAHRRCSQVAHAMSRLADLPHAVVALAHGSLASPPSSLACRRRPRSLFLPREEIDRGDAVDHPYLVLYSKTAEVPNASKDDTKKQECGVCHDPPEDMVVIYLVTSCEHVFCKACLIDYTASSENVTCPSCSKPLTVDLTTKNRGGRIPATAVKGHKSGILNRLHDIEAFRTSTKIDALKEEIRDMVECDGSAKGIVFSQFTSFLDLICFSLQKCLQAGIKCVQLVGNMSLVERDKAIKAFSEDGDCRIFLMSLKAGGVALNLTVASHVSNILVVMFGIEADICILIMPYRTIGHCSEAITKLTEEDLRFLFQV